jgi:hypothetical protein
MTHRRSDVKFIWNSGGERSRTRTDRLHNPTAVRIIRALALSACVIALAESLIAASFIVPSDRRMVQTASAIVVGSALSSHTQLNTNGGIETVTTVSVEDVLKGSIDSGTFDLYEPGGGYEDRWMVIPGVPRFNDGGRYILYLMQSDDGRWHVLDLVLGKFTFATDTLGHDVVIRDLRDVQIWDNDGSSHRESNRAAGPFLEFIRNTVRGAPTKENYTIPAEPLIAPAGSPSETPHLKPINLTTFSANSYLVSFTTEGGTGPRWCGTVLPGMPGSCAVAFPTAVNFGSISSEPGAGGSPHGADAINAAMNAWNTAPGASINYAYTGNDVSGTTNAPHAMGDGKNTIAFEQNLVTCCAVQPFMCSSNSFSGTLGLGGISGTAGSHIGPNGETFFTTVEGDVWMNQGIANCTLLLTTLVGDWNSAVTHEVGHTLGFRHSDQNRLVNNTCTSDATLECANSAIMTAFVTSGLNATLQTWDQNAAAAVYPGVAAPAAPTGVVATATTATNIQVSWTGSCATTCHVYRSSNHTTYTQVGTPATSPFNDTVSSGATSYLYKVRAFNGTESADSNIDLATNVIFTTDPLVANSTVISAVHLAELRTATNAVRLLAGLSPGLYTNSATAGVIVQAVHITEIRTQLDSAMSILGLTTGGYTDGSLAGVMVKAVHFQQIRNRVK